MPQQLRSPQAPGRAGPPSLPPSLPLSPARQAEEPYHPPLSSRTPEGGLLPPRPPPPPPPRQALPGTRGREKARRRRRRPCQASPFRSSRSHTLTMSAECLRWWMSHRLRVCTLCCELLSSESFRSSAASENADIAGPRSARPPPPPLLPPPRRRSRPPTRLGRAQSPPLRPSRGGAGQAPSRPFPPRRPPLPRTRTARR